MSNDKLYTVSFARIELTWFHRHLTSWVGQLEGQMTKINTPSGKVLSPEQNKDLTDVTNNRDQAKQFMQQIEDCLHRDDELVLKVKRVKDELQEALELCEEPEARDAARSEMGALPVDPLINVTLDRPTLRFILKLIDGDLNKFRVSIIPGYEKADVSSFTDKIRTKSYFVNKARKSKNILEKLKTKLEKGL